MLTAELRELTEEPTRFLTYYRSAKYCNPPLLRVTGKQWNMISKDRDRAEKGEHSRKFVLAPNGTVLFDGVKVEVCQE